MLPVLGRTYTREDNDPDAPTIALLGYSFWQSRYSGDPGVLGQTLQVDGVTLEIVGVLRLLVAMAPTQLPRMAEVSLSPVVYLFTLGISLGAEPKHVKGMVMGQGLIIFAVGATLGLGLAFALTRLMSGLLFGVEPVDPLTFALVPLGLLAVALLASYIPARRAARVDVMAALRRE